VVQLFCSVGGCNACFAVTLVLQRWNQVSVEGVCRFIAIMLHNSKRTLDQLQFDHMPSECAMHAAWRSEGLPVPPKGKFFASFVDWSRVLSCLSTSVRLVRAMPHEYHAAYHSHHKQTYAQIVHPGVPHPLQSSVTPCLLCSTPPPPAWSLAAVARARVLCSHLRSSDSQCRSVRLSSR
jgi:hypothetical protein